MTFAVVELIELLPEPSPDDDAVTVRPMMLTVLGLPVMRAVSGVTMQDFDQLPGAD